LGGASVRLLPLVEDIFRSGARGTELLSRKNLLEDQLSLTETLWLSTRRGRVAAAMVTVVIVTWAMAPSCPREPSGPRQTDTLGGSSPPSDSKPSGMLKYKHHSTSGRGSIDIHI
jgi:hypothetical protein